MAVEQILILKLLTDLKQPVQSFAELEARVKTLRKVLKSTPDEGTKAFKELARSISKELNVDIETAKNKIRGFGRAATKEIQEGTEALKVYRKSLRTVKAPVNSINALRQQVKGLVIEVDNLDRSTQEFADKNKELRKLNKTLIDIEKSTLRGGRNVGNYETAFRGFSRVLTGIGIAFGTGFGLASIGRTITEYKELTDVLADVRKTTGLTNDEVRDLRTELAAFETRTTVEELLKIAEGAGRLGIAKDEIAGFTQEIDKLFVSLSDELGGSATEIATDVGKIVSIFKADQDFGGFAEGINAVGSSINFLSANSKATAGFILAATKRIQGFQATIGAGVGDTIGLAAAMDEFGLRSESSTTAYQKFISRVAKTPEVFRELVAEIGVTGDEFDRISASDPNEAFIQVLKAAQTSEKGLKGLNKILTELDIKGTREGETILTLSNNLGRLTELQKLANDELIRGTSLTEEFNTKNDNLAADMADLNKVISEQATLFLQAGDGALREFIQFLTSAVPVLAKNAGLILKVTAVLALFIARARTGQLVLTGITFATRAYSLAIALLAGKMNIATEAMKLFTKVSKANVIGLIITAIAAAVAIYSSLSKELTDAEKAQKSYNEAVLEANKATVNEVNELQSLLLVARDETQSKEDRLEAIKRINEELPEYLANITEENVNTAEGVRIINEYIKALSKKSIAQALSAKLQDISNRIVEEEGKTYKDRTNAFERFILSEKQAQDVTNNRRRIAIVALQLEKKAIEELIAEKLREGEISVGGLGGGTDDPTPDDDDKDKLTTLEELLKLQKELSEEIKNRIANGQDYSKQLTEFNKITKELTRIEKEYKKAIGETDKTIKAMATGSVRLYDKQIKELKEALDGVNIESDEYLKISQKIVGLEEEKADALLLTSTRTKEYQEALANLQAKVKEGGEDLGITQGALKQLQNVTAAGEKGADEIKRIYEKLSADLEQVEKNRLLKTQRAIQEQIEDINSEEQIAIADAGDNEQKKLDIINYYAKLRGDAELELLGVKGQLLKKELDEFTDAEKKKRDEAKKTTEAITEEERKKKAIRDAAFDVANNLNAAIFEILDNRAQEETDRLNAALDKEEESALKSAEILGATEAQKEEIKRRFEAKREAVEKEAGRKAKQRAIIEATINTALAVTKALASLKAPFSFIAAALAASLGAIQIAAISSQQFALGGIFDNQVRSNHPKHGRGAYLNQGAYHSQGGMPIINPHTGQKVAEIEKDEVILNRRSMASKDIISVEGTPYEIANVLNTHRGYGRAFPRKKSSRKSGAKMIKAHRAIKYRQGGSFGINKGVMKMASGAVFSSDIQRQSTDNVQSDEDQKKLTLALIEEVRELRKSNSKGFNSIPSTAEELKRANQLVLDEDAAT